MAATGTAAPAHANAPQAPAAPAPAPFRVGTQNTTNLDGYTQTVTLGASTQQLPVYNPTVNAFLRGIYILAQNTVTGQSTNNVAFTGDGPFNVYQTISFNDTQGKPIILVDGYRLMLINKFGGYHFLGDPRASSAYTTTTGTVSTAGSFSFILYVPLEIVSRDALGAVVNKNQASPLQLVLTVNTAAAVFSTAASTSSSFQTRIVEDGWWQPKAADATGQPLSQSPPAPNTIAYWLQSTFSALNGSTQIQLPTGLGYPIRNIFFIGYDTSNSTRATFDSTDCPDPLELLYKGTILYNVPKVFWKDRMSRMFGTFASAVTSSVLAGTPDTANGLENGVFVLPFNQDFGLKPGDELRNGYLVTQQGDQFQFVGTFNASSTLYELVNYVAPGNGNPAALRAQR